MSSNSSVSTDALEQSAMSFLGEYFGHFPDRDSGPNNHGLIEHFDQVAKDLFAKARECLAASDLLRSGRAPLPTPVRKVNISRQAQKSKKVIPCAVEAREVRGVPSHGYQSTSRSAAIEVERFGTDGLHLYLRDLWTGRCTVIRINPASQAEGQAMADTLRTMAKTLEADGERAEYRRSVPSDRLCKFCKRATVRPAHVTPGTAGDAHRDLHYCMTCKAYLDAPEGR